MALAVAAMFFFKDLTLYKCIYIIKTFEGDLKKDGTDIGNGRERSKKGVAALSSMERSKQRSRRYLDYCPK